MEFSFTRFKHLVVKQFSNNFKVYGLCLICVPIIYLLTIVVFFSDELKIANPFFVLGLFIVGGIFANTVIGSFSKKASAIQLLMSPVSALEKMLLAVLLTYLVFPIIFGTIAYLSINCAIDININMFGNFGNKIGFENGEFKVLVAMYFLMVTFALLGSLLFKKFVWPKTFLLSCLLFFIIIQFNNILAKQMVGQQQPKTFKYTNVKSNFTVNKNNKFQFLNATAFNKITVNIKSKDDITYDISANKTAGYIASFTYFATLMLLLLATYHGLKEKQI